MFDLEERVILVRVVLVIVDESLVKLVRELMESKIDDLFEECKRINLDWLLDQGILIYKGD